jgi:hypothetical protein
MWIFGKQMQDETEACFRYDLVISDRTLVDCIAYTQAFGYYSLANSMEHLVFESFRRYQQVIFRYIAKNDYPQNDGFRNLNEPVRDRIERIMPGIYKRLGVTLSESETPVSSFLKTETFRPFHVSGTSNLPSSFQAVSSKKAI